MDFASIFKYGTEIGVIIYFMFTFQTTLKDLTSVVESVRDTNQTNTNLLNQLKDLFLQEKKQ